MTPSAAGNVGSVRLWRLAALTVGVVLTSALIGAPAHADAPVELVVSATRPEISSGEPVPIMFTVTNRGSAACSLQALAGGAVQVIAVGRDGVAPSNSWPVWHLTAQ